MLYLMYAYKNDIALLMKFIEDGFNLRGGMDKIASGIDAKKQGYSDIFYRGMFKPGLEKTILGDEMVVRGMRQGGKALFNLAVDNVYAVALNELRDSGMDGQFLLDMY
ncbi:uncharacterized protein LOC121731982 [Aricia agestis]|uniref:uncharacterized protein LOC121731982 n=1 Tax=Aricia agestis TaxID=91739 RepID=UPI001C204BCE|nr:uncharacterized protein LOC121731982 [Aricia agestis]